MYNATEINVLNGGPNFIRIGDERVKDWPLMSNPLPLTCIIIGYLTIIYKLGPAYMQNQKPYNLKSILAIYNVFQILACCYLVNGMLRTDQHAIVFWKCQNMDYGLNEKALTLLKYTHLVFLLKVVELIETVFFVLRKKNNQVSSLHVYHHVSTAVLCWIMVKYHGGGMILFSIIINSCVHIIMYSYYFLAIFGAAVQRKLQFIKKSITLIQMIQFCFILYQCIIGIGCDVPKPLLMLYAPNIVLIFYMFYNFFQTAYVKKTNKVM